MDTLTTPAAATRTLFSPSDHLRAAVNELKFGWTFQTWPTFPPDSVVYLLGRSYQTKNGKNMWMSSQASSPYGRYSEFADDFASRLWFTYRSDFPQLCTTNEPRPSESHSLPPFSMVQNLVMPEMNNSDIPEARSRSLFIESNSETSVDSFEVPEIGYHGSCSVSAAGLFSDPSNTKQDKNARIMRKLSSFIHVKRSHRKVLIPMSIQTSDCGWGCMIRSGQMLLAHALVLHFLGRDWRAFRKGSPIRTAQNPLYRQIIRWFHDSWSPDALLSLHRIVQVSSRSPGSWFGPATMCSALIKVMANAAIQSDTLAQIQLYLARDRVIYRKELMDLARGNGQTSRCDRTSFTDHTGNYQPSIPTDAPNTPSLERRCSSSPASRAIVLLIPLMLGPDVRINPVYAALVCGLFRDPCSIGLIGGRPRHSVYVVGSEQKRQQLIYLDPHFTQPVVDISRTEFSTKSWHCLVPRIMNVLQLDPSCAVGFYCRSRGELSDLLDRIPSLFSVHSGTSDGHIKGSLVEVVNS